MKVKVLRKILKIADGAPLLHLKLFPLSDYTMPLGEKLLVLNFSKERQPGVISQRRVETFHELLLLIVVPVCAPLGAEEQRNVLMGERVTFSLEVF